MDTKKDSRIPKCGGFPDCDDYKIVVGSKQLRKALVDGRARRVWLAENADPAITEPIENLCRVHFVEYVWVCSKEQLGRACGIDVGAAAAAAVD